MAVNNTRLGFANGYDNAIRNLSSRQSQLATLQENLTSGKRVVKASDDPTAAAQAERSLTRLARIAADQRALEAQKNTISVAESTLGDITDALQRFRELTVNAGSGSLTPSERKTIAVELTGLREQILSYANRKDNNGQPVFAALGSAQNPFSGPLGGTPDYSFQGLPGQAAASEVGIASTLDGESAFMLQTQRDGAFNVSLSAIPSDRSLSTSQVSVADPTQVATTATLAAGVPVSPALGFPKYTITFTSVVANPTTKETTATYSISESPPLNTPISDVTVTYPTASPTAITITAIPGLSLTVNGVPPSTDKLSANPTGSPAQGDVITIDYSPSIFSVLDDAIRDIGGAVNGNAAAQAVGQALNNIDIGMGRINAVRGQAGDLLNRADRISSNQDLRSVQLEADRSRAEDLDMIKGVSDFQNQQTGYQAALQSYAQVQKLSLFNYLS